MIPLRFLSNRAISSGLAAKVRRRDCTHFGGVSTKIGRDFATVSWKILRLNMKNLILTCLVGLSLGLVNAHAADEPKKDEPKKDVKEVAVIKTTAGEMVAEFWPDVAPKTVENFKTLARKGLRWDVFPPRDQGFYDPGRRSAYQGPGKGTELGHWRSGLQDRR